MQISTLTLIKSAENCFYVKRCVSFINMPKMNKSDCTVLKLWDKMLQLCASFGIIFKTKKHIRWPLTFTSNLQHFLQFSNRHNLNTALLIKKQKLKSQVNALSNEVLYVTKYSEMKKSAEMPIYKILNFCAQVEQFIPTVEAYFYWYSLYFRFSAMIINTPHFPLSLGTPMDEFFSTRLACNILYLSLAQSMHYTIQYSSIFVVYTAPTYMYI